MRRSANTLLHVIKDQVRMVRYSIRQEAETPGSALPKAVRDEIGPLVAIGSMIGTPALRFADGIFTQVESLATDVLLPAPGVEPSFPCPVEHLFQEEHSFSHRLYGPVKALLRRHGARKMLVSEQALDTAWTRIVARHGDTMPSGTAGGQARSAQATQTLVQVCAGIACGLNDARPIRKVVFDDVGTTNKYFMLSPNMYCGMMVGLVTAVVTLRPELMDERDSVLESVESVVNARFDRFKRCLMSKSPVTELAAAYEGLLPFIP